MGTRFVWLAMFVGAALLPACQSAPTPGATCVHASECASPLTCAFGRCRAACVQNRDCPSGSSCLPGPMGSSCTVDTDLGCETGVGRMCPMGLVCVADRCAATCTTSSECPSDGECRAGPTPGISFCYDSRVPQPDAGPASDAASDDAAPPSIDAAMDASMDAGMDAPSQIDAGNLACTEVCIQGGDDGAVGERACAVCGGRVWCWGSDADGGLGDGPVMMSMGTPRPVVTGAGVQLAAVRAITCGAQHACALTVSGTIFCWGTDSGSHGTLGRLSAGDHAAPQTTTSGITFDAIAAGAYHTCGRSSAPAHVVNCWGENGQGACDPTRPYVDVMGTMPTAITMATTPLGTRSARTLAAGLARTCIVEMGTTTFRCTGFAEYGAAGLPAEIDHVADASVTIPLVTAPDVVAFGRAHQCLLRSGRLYCMGANMFSALGLTGMPPDCLGACAATPIEVSGGGTTYTVLGSGSVSFHTCVAEPGGVLCWGRNDHQQCGINTATMNVGSPSPVPGFDTMTVTALATGVVSSCAVADGSVYCWGSNADGQLGRGTHLDGDFASPARVAIP